MGAYLIWIGIFLATAVVVEAAQYPLRRSQKKWPRVVAFLVKLVVLVVVSAMVISFDSYLVWHLNKLLSALHCVLLGDLAVELVLGVAALVRKQDLKPMASTAVCLAAAVAMCVYATVNAQLGVVREAAVTSDKLDRDYTFALLADTHIGTSEFYGAFEANLDKTAALSPDFVVLAGDVVDDFATSWQMNYAFDAIGQRLVAKGIPVYYAYGNHDRQFCADSANGHQYSYDEIAQAMERNGIVAAQDEYVKIGDDLLFLGRQDATEESRLSGPDVAALNPDRGAFLLMADHSPLDQESPKDIRPDLAVSGHTHAGQVFTSQVLSLLWESPSYGISEYDYETLLVTAGTGGWGPVRTRENCEIWLVSLQSAK
ncbi:MAG: metallophosphoesterase [Coriobacteriia bacterium]|nr:metallophosphoesterase [Coriobacteriia bacterium]